MKFIAISLLTILVMLPNARSSSAAVIHDTTPSAEYEAHAANFPSVGYIEGVLGDDSDFGSSGTLIDPYWVLTAAHSVDHENESVTYRFGLGSNSIDGTGDEYDVAEVFLHPEYTSPGVSVDIALLRLTTPVYSVAPVTIFTGSVPVGSEVNGVGYGSWGTPGTGFQPYDGNKRAIVNNISRFGDSFYGIPDDYLITEFLRPNHVGAKILGGAGSHGDSGGGVFFDVNSEMQLVAVTGFEIGIPHYGADTGSLNLNSQHREWISETMASVPEPSSLVLLALGSMGLLLRTPRRQQSSSESL